MVELNGSVFTSRNSCSYTCTPQWLTVGTFGATQCHNQRAVALVQLPEAGAAGSVSDDRQLFQNESLEIKRRR